MAGRDRSDEDRGPRSASAEAGDVDYTEYYDDGEWHVVMMEGAKAVASGHGDSPEAARRSLFGTTELE